MMTVSGVLRRCLTALGALVAVVHLTPLTDWWAQALSSTWNRPRGQVLVVLAGSSLTGGVMGDSTYWRVIYAARAWKEHPFAEVLLCGGPEGTPVSGAMRSFLIAEGVPAERIRLETTSDSTRQNALEAARLLARSPAGERLLLTSDYHMLRAERAFQRAGVAVVSYPVPDARKRAARWTGRWSAFVDVALETGKLAYYAIKGWI